MANIRSDTDLVNEFRQGNRRAFEEILGRYQKQIYHFALGLSANHHSAEEISHETWIKFWKSIGSGAFDQTQPVYPYLRTICLNLARDYFTGHHQIKQLGDIEVAANDCPADSVDQSGVRQAIESLMPEYRTVLTLRVVEGLSYQEISGQLNCPVGTVMSRLYRARMELRGKLRVMNYKL